LAGGDVVGSDAQDVVVGEVFSLIKSEDGFARFDLEGFLAGPELPVEGIALIGVEADGEGFLADGLGDAVRSEFPRSVLGGGLWGAVVPRHRAEYPVQWHRRIRQSQRHHTHRDRIQQQTPVPRSELLLLSCSVLVDDMLARELWRDTAGEWAVLDGECPCEWEVA